MTEPIFTIQVSGTAELIAKLQQLSYLPKSPRMRALLEDAGNAYVVLAMQDVPKATRFLKASINHKVEGWGSDNPGVRIGAGGPGAGYAYYVEVGTRPSVRFARQRRFMHWFMEGGKTLQVPFGPRGTTAYGVSIASGSAESVFAKKVRHPGTRPQPFFFKQMELIGPRFLEALARLINEDMAVGGPSPS